MSLAIDVDTVVAVLLADGWHEVFDNTFSLDSYEFLWSGREGASIQEARDDFDEYDAEIVHGGGESGICATGFAMRTVEGWIYGPLTSILAVRTSRS